MWNFYTDTKQKARKDYVCDACMLLLDGNDDLTDEEQQLFDKARSEGFKILKGKEYIKVSGKWEGDFSVFRARPEIDQICLRLGLYEG